MKLAFGTVAEQMNRIVTGIALCPLRHQGNTVPRTIKQDDRLAGRNPVGQNLPVGDTGINQNRFLATIVLRRIGGLNFMETR